MNRTGRTGIFVGMGVVLALLAGVHPAAGQQRGSGAGGGPGSSDPALQRARQETMVVLDLGRLISFVGRMDEEGGAHRLSSAQARRLVRLMGEVQTTSRLTPAIAERMMAEIEDDILTAGQLLRVDMLWAEADRTRSPSAAGTSGRQGNEGGAEGSLSSYAAGGPFNPLTDASRPQGQEFEELYERLRSR